MKKIKTNKNQEIKIELLGNNYRCVAATTVLSHKWLKDSINSTNLSVPENKAIRYIRVNDDDDNLINLEDYGIYIGERLGNIIFNSDDIELDAYTINVLAKVNPELLQRYRELVEINERGELDDISELTECIDEARLELIHYVLNVELPAILDECIEVIEE